MGPSKLPLISGNPRARQGCLDAWGKPRLLQLVPSPCPTMEDGVLLEALGCLVRREDTERIEEHSPSLRDVLRDDDTVVRQRVDIGIERSKGTDPGSFDELAIEQRLRFAGGSTEYGRLGAIGEISLYAEM